MLRPSALLLPQPRTLEPRDGELWLPRSCRIVASTGAEIAAEQLIRTLGRMGLRATIGGGAAAQLRLALDSEEPLGTQGYRIAIEPDGVDIVGADAAGLFYGATTLAQWLRLAGRLDGDDWVAPRVSMRDAPDFPVRGFLLDISRNRVPRLDTLFELVELLSSLKFNQLQLYTEHTFAYRGHERVWRDSSPLTAREVRELDLFCRARCVELVPNQNCLGHFHRWLVHEPYRALAERPEGLEHPFSRVREPFSLCPTDPASLELIEDLLEQLLPNFSSRLVNIGLDEAFDIGSGRSAAACAESGKQEVYLEFLERVDGLVRGWGRRSQFWGDIVLERPDLIERLPSDVIALDWGYEADHPFESETRAFASAGLEFYVCPGTSSWNSLGGRLDVAMANLSLAARSGQAAGATGFLLTDWGDFGHLQPPAISYPAIVAGAAHAWRAPEEESGELALRELLYHHVPELGDKALVAALEALGTVHSRSGVTLRNGSVLFRLLVHADETLEHERYERLTRAGLEDALTLLDTIDLPRGEARGLVSRELDWVRRTLTFCCELGLERLEAGPLTHLSEVRPTGRAKLAQKLEPLIEELPELWLARSRPGGLQDSLGYLTRVRDLLT